jgi:hypothetical protein
MTVFFSVGGEILHQLTDCQLLKDTVPWGEFARILAVFLSAPGKLSRLFRFISEVPFRL